MSKYKPIFYQSVEKCVDEVIKRVGKNIVLGMPLGLGKANHVANELYRRVKEDPGMNLTIITALSLERPTPTTELERRFIGPFIDRVFGGYVDLAYVNALRKGELPSNIEVKEFYTKAGAYLKVRHAQQNYISSNIVWKYGYITIPRHLRDIVITEYGIADLRARSDQDVIAAMLNITDSRFQDSLLLKYQKNARESRRHFSIRAGWPKTQENTNCGRFSRQESLWRILLGMKRKCPKECAPCC
jgi:acyl-CoA hydrolase